MNVNSKCSEADERRDLAATAQPLPSKRVGVRDGFGRNQWETFWLHSRLVFLLNSLLPVHLKRRAGYRRHSY